MYNLSVACVKVVALYVWWFNEENIFVALSRPWRYKVVKASSLYLERERKIIPP